MTARFGFSLLTLAFWCGAGLAQVTGGGVIGSGAGVQRSGSFSGTFTTSTMAYMGAAITGAPYSAEQVNESVQTLADGTHITRSMPAQKMYRDSQGRTRTERQMGMSMNGHPASGPVMIEIRDPVDGVAYILDTAGKVAHRIKMQPMQPRMLPPAASARPATVMPPPVVTRPEMTNESLGQQTIEGLLVEGRRTTVTEPVGAIGNDRPLVSTNEVWMSPELHVMVLSKSSSPQGGVSTTKLTNISRVEPDINLFRPPVDYTVVDETGPSVTIHYGAQ